MPGVLQIEAMAQVGGVMILNDIPNAENYTTLFLKIENAKFKEMVVPGDTMLIRMELIGQVRRGICMMKGQIFVGNRVVTEAELMAQIVKQK
jgi:UDP-3-O-[3-hydroxymyristoyl] N-acetylglucosamine deacetylase/3-hydroxyacyl-[acyl-carrier-protein] dehydratase